MVKNHKKKTVARPTEFHLCPKSTDPLSNIGPISSIGPILV